MVGTIHGRTFPGNHDMYERPVQRLQAGRTTGMNCRVCEFVIQFFIIGNFYGELLRSWGTKQSVDQLQLLGLFRQSSEQHLEYIKNFIQNGVA